ncbi:MULTISPECIES: F0F1 ATP synthase subunit delta [Brachybacterium]|uniref:ATP synthase subunit delta n=1 Tax=Brachybacterium alimentarium TaxID=47845 RepID=A0A2A3YGK8_9MICO|nr:MULTISPECIES: F0F1 ATP synthase subunit delta [Brachybacterium]PCC32837.1 F0F1 ATP synthase subunit delta [Brachybacterium alimentarium]PCC38902.1 F0F1 ATP synthase subunit delta [Brachybacterium alimentarium]RCS64250.1 F0F1 ATP synthase subunit delta [Brachybacterium sp. JB7]RCS68571.1 F0F1 ATP synthase subunit delta [Brachybacterium alimentarium]RCS72048.1 F0F1 ATP synthase subunit delta [Brachybacterium alimentarium]
MRGTSSTSFAEVAQQAQSVFATDGVSLDSTADELFAIADAIDSSNQLVRLLSDSGRGAEAKEAAVRALLAGKVSDAALGLTLGVVSHRWSEQEDILDALERLGVLALLEQSERESSLGQVEEELFQFSRTIDDSAELSSSFDDAREDPSARGNVVRTLLEGRANRLTTALAVRAVSRAVELKPSRRVREFAEFASERRQRLLAVVETSRPLDEAQQSRLGTVLARIYGREVQMNLEVSQDVVGGLRIHVGDDLYDATVLARLSQAREHLVS